MSHSIVIGIIFLSTLVTCNFGLLPPLNNSRIVGGELTNISEYPHQVSLRLRLPWCLDCSYKHMCGASIYSSKAVITAAHCVNGATPDILGVVAGTNKLTGDDGIFVSVEKIIYHKNFLKLTFDYDVAVLILADELKLNERTIKAIKLATINPTVGTIATVTGWGAIYENSELSDDLMKVNVPIVDTRKCGIYYSNYEYGTVTNRMICAGFKDGNKDACQGDSGGPLIANNELIGIVSWGNGCAQAQYPGVYTSVAILREWIEENIKNNLN